MPLPGTYRTLAYMVSHAIIFRVCPNGIFSTETKICSDD